MKQGTGISASVGAILSSLASLSCCLPVGFAAAIGAGAANAMTTAGILLFLGSPLKLVMALSGEKLRNKSTEDRAASVEVH